MTWRGLVRSMAAAQRRMERESLRRQRELERQNVLLNKMQASERAAYEVSVYENRIELLLSVHKQVGEEWNWERIKRLGAPLQPLKKKSQEEFAQLQLKQYQPSTIEKLTGRAEKKRQELLGNLSRAQQQDESEHKKALGIYEADLKEWQARRELAERVVEGDLDAYVEVIEEVEPLSDIGVLGSSVRFSFKNASMLEVGLRVNGEKVIPSETKSLLKSGKISVKEMPKTKFYELYQDYVCGCVLRVAREVFALLPLNIVIVTAVGEVLNNQTGHLESKAILSVAIPRDTLKTLNFETLDPSDSMRNFVHRMSFKRGQSFGAIEPLSHEQFKMDDN